MNSLVSRTICRRLLFSQSSSVSRTSFSGLAGEGHHDKNKSEEDPEHISQRHAEDSWDPKDKSLNKKDEGLLRQQGFEQEKPTSAPHEGDFDIKISHNKKSREATKEHEMERTGKDPHKDFQYEEIDLDKDTNASSKYKDKN